MEDWMKILLSGLVGALLTHSIRELFVYISRENRRKRVKLLFLDDLSCKYDLINNLIRDYKQMNEKGELYLRDPMMTLNEVFDKNSFTETKELNSSLFRELDKEILHEIFGKDFKDLVEINSDIDFLQEHSPLSIFRSFSGDVKEFILNKEQFGDFDKGVERKVDLFRCTSESLLKNALRTKVKIDTIREKYLNKNK